MADSNNTWESSQLGQYLIGGGVTEILTGKGEDGKFLTTSVNDYCKGKYIGVYFSAHWCPPCRNYTPTLAKKYEELQEAGLTILFVSSDQSEKAFEEYFAEMPWGAVPFKHQPALKETKAFELARGIPTLYLFDKEGALYQKGGRGAVMDGRPFPYGNPSWEDVLEIVVDGEGNKVDASEITSKPYIGLYFSAHWCPPCRGFTPQLVKVYEKIMASDITNDGNDFEIIFVSSDRSANDYKGYFADMPWKSLDFNNPKFQMYSSSLKQKYENEGIPQFAIVRGSDGNLLTKNARGGVSSDPEGKDFPWPRKAMYTLQEDLEGIDSNKSIVLMMDKGTDADKDEIYQFMSSHAKAQQALKEEREFFHFAAMVADTRAAPKIREFTSLGEESAMICLDLRSKSFWKAALPTSAADVQAFATSITDGTAEKHALQL